MLSAGAPQSCQRDDTIERTLNSLCLSLRWHAKQGPASLLHKELANALVNDSGGMEPALQPTQVQRLVARNLISNGMGMPI